VASEVFLPRLTHDMNSGVLVRWLKSDGDRVAAGEPLYEVETDKAVSEVAAEAGGILRRLKYQEGDEIPIGTVIAYLLVEGEALPQEGTAGQPERSARHSSPVSTPADAAGEAAPHRSGITATPIARRIAREKGIDLSLISGTGPQGRIIERDVLAFLTRSQPVTPAMTSPTPLAPAEVPYQSIPLTRTQVTTGHRMAFSSQNIPQFTLEVDVDMSEAQRLRQHAGEPGVKPPGYTALLVRVAAEALRTHPEVNTSLDGESLRHYREINIGVAVAGREGLLVPVIHAADSLRLEQVQELLNRIRAQAERGVLEPAFLSGGTFTLSNLGMYGIDRFQALVNPPQAAILAAGRIRPLPWVVEGGVQVRPILTLRLSADHRILDGATAAPFLADVKHLLENPYRMI
jgi:pyruvate dehydrogenase E2 component (dihydrolipoamide acetyltransferase)